MFAPMSTKRTTTSVLCHWTTTTKKHQEKFTRWIGTDTEI